MFRYFLLTLLVSLTSLSASTSLAHHQGIKYGTFKIESGKFLFYKAKSKKAEVVKFGDCIHLHELSSRLEKEATEIKSILPSEMPVVELNRVVEAAKFVHNNQHRKSRKAIAEKLSGLNNSLKAARRSYLESKSFSLDSEENKIILNRFETGKTVLLHLLNDAGVSTHSN